jgi:mannose/fructose/N-acetylgalactosamine-specific phosphotransferase system component IIC
VSFLNLKLNCYPNQPVAVAIHFFTFTNGHHVKENANKAFIQSVIFIHVHRLCILYVFRTLPVLCVSAVGGNCMLMAISSGLPTNHDDEELAGPTISGRIIDLR